MNDESDLAAQIRAQALVAVAEALALSRLLEEAASPSVAARTVLAVLEARLPVAGKADASKRAALLLRDAGLSGEDIGEVLGDEIRAPRRSTAALRAAILELHEHGLTVADIAARLDVSGPAVRKHLRYEGLQPNGRRRNLSDAEVRAVWRLYDDGVGPAEITRRLGHKLADVKNTLYKLKGGPGRRAS